MISLIFFLPTQRKTKETLGCCCCKNPSVTKRLFVLAEQFANDWLLKCYVIFKCQCGNKKSLIWKLNPIMTLRLKVNSSVLFPHQRSLSIILFLIYTLGCSLSAWCYVQYLPSLCMSGSIPHIPDSSAFCLLTEYAWLLLHFDITPQGSRLEELLTHCLHLKAEKYQSRELLSLCTRKHRAEHSTKWGLTTGPIQTKNNSPPILSEWQ